MPRVGIYDQRELHYPSLYDEGFARIGCVVCPFIMDASPHSTAERARSMQRWPGVWKAFEHSCKAWWEATCSGGLRANQRHANAEDYWRAYLVGFDKKKSPRLEPRASSRNRITHEVVNE